MAIDYFIGWTEAQLEVELRRAQEDLAAGASVGSVGAGDTQTQQIQQLQIQQRIEMLYRKLYALNPTDYPIASIARVDRAVYGDPH